jgi:hypothetical protein
MSGQIDEISLLDLKSLRVRYDASDRHDRLRRSRSTARASLVPSLAETSARGATFQERGGD